MMRIKSLLVVVLALIGLIALSVSVSGAVLLQEGATAVRPTATAGPLPLDYEPSSPNAPEALPDLIVSEIRVSPADPRVNAPVDIFVTIENIGTGDVEPDNNFILDFYINPPTDDLRGLRGDYYWHVQWYEMPAGGSATFYTSTILSDAVSYNLWAQVDTPTPPELPLGNVLESNEDNNIRGPEYVTVRTRRSWVQKDHEDFFTNMASTLDVVPVSGTVGIITNTSGLVLDGDSALALGIFEEPPQETWGLPAIPPGDMPDYNMIYPDTRVNQVVDNDQRYPIIHARDDLVVAVWQDGRNGPIYQNDVFLRWSGDEGETWHDEIQVNDEALNDQIHPSVAVAPDGRIVVAWQDHRGSSFDIYVQVFAYSGGSLVRCHANGDCSSVCNPASQDCNFRVDTDANHQDQIVPDVAADEVGNFFVVWQDQRNNNDDIFAVRSYTSTSPCPTYREELGFLPDLPVQRPAAPDQVHLCWGDDTRIHDDPAATKQARPSVAAVYGIKITGIEYEVIPGDPPEVDITKVYSEPTTFVTVAWEDDREGDTDIYLSYSDDEGETFVFDTRLNDDKPSNTKNWVEQLDPAVATNQWMKQITIVVPVGDGSFASTEIKVPVTTMHIVWQDFRNSTDAEKINNPDIYYTAITVEPNSEPPFEPIFRYEGQEQVNENDGRSWQRGPVWQGEPDVAATPSGLVLEESEGYNAFVVWADGRNYGGELDNIDVYFRLFSNVGAPTEFVGGNNVAVNNHARNHNFDPDTYGSYKVSFPPHARQHFPSIASTLVAHWPTIFDGYLYVAWHDDRIEDPFVDRNIHLTRSNLMFGGHRDIFLAPGVVPEPPGQGERYGSGAFVSDIFDSYSDETVWYVLDWHAATDSGTYITVQTRLGDTVEEVLNGDWYPKEFPYPDDAVSVGSPLQGYDAPGQHIQNASGDYHPEARYIQYRVNMWARDAAENPGTTVLNTPFLFDVILYYERPPIIYLPLVFHNHW